MSYRKVQRTAKGSYLLSLPKSWATSYGVEKNQALLVVQNQDGSLSIYPPKLRSKAVEIRIKMGSAIEKEITWAYLLGADSLEITSDVPMAKEDVEKVKAAVNKLPGFEIMEEESRRMLVSSLMEAGPGSAEKLLQKMLLITKAMELDSVQAAVTGNAEAARDLTYRDDEVDRLYFMLVRLTRGAIVNPSLGEKAGLSPLRALDVRQAAEILENLADLAVKLAELTEKQGNSLKSALMSAQNSEATLRAIEELVQVQESGISAFSSQDFQATLALTERTSSVSSMLEGIKAEETCDVPSIAELRSVISQMIGRTRDLLDLVPPRRNPPETKVERTRSSTYPCETRPLAYCRRSLWRPRETG